MGTVANFVKRNCRVYYRSGSSVFFSLMAVLIILLLNVFFISTSMERWLNTYVGNAEVFVATWVMAGLFSVTAVTTTLGAMGVMVEDETWKIKKDFYSSPVSRVSLTLGYICSALLIGTILSLLSILGSQFYIVAIGGTLFSPQTYLNLFLVMLLNVLNGSAMMFLLSTFLHSNSAFVGASTVVGTVIGFLNGIYVPIGQLPNVVQSVIKFFPPAHGAALYRQIMCAESLAAMGYIPPQTLDYLNFSLGIQYQIGGITVSPLCSVLFLLGCTLFCFTLGVYRMGKGENKIA